ncbi:asialoglycoprotein receptor 2-like [Paramisgurnus dabryanus]|uniref:asialoglycoprotein receptor 2-like n=1 Tax=Paramisgurnus dabryanus TaxID=90735 RepID=UPI0031F37CEC
MRTVKHQMSSYSTTNTKCHHQLYIYDPHYSNLWIYYNLSFYYISSQWRSWSDSKQDCEQRGANLIIINNQEEQEFVLKATAGQLIWIGLSKEGEVWKWDDGTTLTLSFWMNGYPKSDNQYCAVISSSGWADYSCGYTNRWICEKRILQ